MNENTSIRREEREFDEPDLDDLSLTQITDLVHKLRSIAINGYTMVTITIKGRSDELEDLADELQTWTPVPGWSEDAQKLFKALRGQ